MSPAAPPRSSQQSCVTRTGVRSHTGQPSVLLAGRGKHRTCNENLHRQTELIDPNHRIVARLRFLREMRAHAEMLEFRIGDRVTSSTLKSRRLLASGPSATNGATTGSPFGPTKAKRGAVARGVKMGTELTGMAKQPRPPARSACATVGQKV